MNRTKTGVAHAMKTLVRRFSGDESGATAIEYGLIVALIFLAILGAVTSYTESASDMYSDISSALSG